MSELANITSVQVTWNQPEGGLVVDEYVVSYCCLNGTDGQCSSPQNGVNVTVRAEANTIALHLQADSSYNITVTGRKGGLYNTSTSQDFMTNSTATTSDAVAIGVGFFVVVIIIIIAAAVILTVIALLYYR